LNFCENIIMNESFSQSTSWGTRQNLRVLVVAILGVLLLRRVDALASFLTFRVLNLAPETPSGEAVRFFLYDTPKVLMLLIGVVFVVGVVRSYFTPGRTRRLLAGRHRLTAHVMGALLGVATPFCTCSAIPLFIGFLTAGIPIGATLSFLVSAPMVNEIALALLWGLFGWKIALLYAATGLSIAILAGVIIGSLRPERFIEPWALSQTSDEYLMSECALSWNDRMERGWFAVKDIVGKVWLWVVVGISLGAIIHGWVPEQALANIMGSRSWWAVPAAVLLGVPLYSNAAGIIPIVQALLSKGAAMGTVLAFMMAVIGLSFPEAIILRKVLKLPLLAMFFGTVALGIMLVGFLFNLIL
jgi:uncharacterized membrane protein YraQ (UPF0718 family)